MKLPPRDGLQNRIVDVAAAHNRLVRIVLLQRTGKRQCVIVILRMLI